MLLLWWPRRHRRRPSRAAAGPCCVGRGDEACAPSGLRAGEIPSKHLGPPFIRSLVWATLGERTAEGAVCLWCVRAQGLCSLVRW